MAGVVLSSLTKRFKTVTAVSDVSLEVLDKEFLVLVGPSGCGKTTTLRAIAGLETVDEIPELKAKIRKIVEEIKQKEMVEAE